MYTRIKFTQTRYVYVIKCLANQQKPLRKTITFYHPRSMIDLCGRRGAPSVFFVAMLMSESKISVSMEITTVLFSQRDISDLIRKYRYLPIKVFI